MNWKKFVLTFVAVFVVNAALSFLIHAVLLNADYAQYPDLLRTQEERSGTSPSCS